MIPVSGASRKQGSLVMRPVQATSGRDVDDSRYAATTDNRQARWSMAARSVYASPVATTGPLEAVGYPGVGTIHGMEPVWACAGR
jgi:hypothetical protein